MEMNKQQSGFTLIELVMVIVILGILAAVAVPKFIDLEGEARQASVNGIAGSLGSAAAVNYAARSVSASAGVAVTNCTDISGALQGGLSGYTITAGAIAAGATATCTVADDDDGTYTATFSGIGIN